MLLMCLQFYCNILGFFSFVFFTLKSVITCKIRSIVFLFFVVFFWLLFLFRFWFSLTSVWNLRFAVHLSLKVTRSCQRRNKRLWFWWVAMFFLLLSVSKKLSLCGFIWKTNSMKRWHFEWVMSVFCTNLIKLLLKIPTILFCRLCAFLSI